MVTAMDMKMAFELFLAGLSLGWGPCLAYCAVIITPYMAGTKTGWKKGLRNSIVFSAGRLAAYMLLGALAGFSGKIFSSLYLAGNFSNYIQTAGGIYIFLIGIAVIAGKSSSISLCRHLDKHSIKSMAVLGLLVGLAPCAPLTGILLYMILKCSNILEGAIYGLFFGVGTMLSPIIIIGAIAGFLPGKVLKNPKINLWFRRLCGVIIIYFSVKLLLPLI